MRAAAVVAASLSGYSAAGFSPQGVSKSPRESPTIHRPTSKQSWPVNSLELLANPVEQLLEKPALAIQYGEALVQLFNAAAN
jgi:hypothetical protein